MSQYNLNGFNRSPYNTKPDYNVNWLNAEFSERVAGSFGTAAEDWLSINANERVTFIGVITPVRYKTATGTERVTASIQAVRTIYLSKTYDENVSESVHIAQGVKTSAELSETVNGTLALGYDAYLDVTFSENITEDITIGSNKTLSAEGYELISSVAGAEAVSEMVCYLDVQLQPGSTIVIDASNYNVFIDGENAIWVQSGDWLDNLNRETISLDIQAATGGSGLDATILYTERYL